MAIDFPNTPTVGQTFTSNGRTWQYTSAGVWDSLAANTSPGDFSVDGSFTASNYDVAGKNKIINGGFDIWQRLAPGTTSFSNPNGYIADRYKIIRLTNTNWTASQITSGLSGTNYALRIGRNSGDTNTSSIFLGQSFETKDVITWQSKTMTFSFYARAGANYSQTGSNLTVMFATGTDIDAQPLATMGGEVLLVANAAAKLVVNTWTRYSYTFQVPSNATSARFNVSYSGTGTAGAADYFDITGVQLEAGSVATPFSRAGGTIAGELAACQRYYWRSTTANNAIHCAMVPHNASTARGVITFPVTMRTVVGAVETNGSPGDYVLDGMNGDATYAATGIAPVTAWYNNNNMWLSVSVSSGLTSWHTYFLRNQTGTAYLAFSAEL